MGVNQTEGKLSAGGSWAGRARNWMGRSRKKEGAEVMENLSPCDSSFQVRLIHHGVPKFFLGVSGRRFLEEIGI